MRPARRRPTDDWPPKHRDPSVGFIYETVPRVSAAILAYDLDAPPIELVDRPLVQRRNARVSGPFTVEALSPPGNAGPADADRVHPARLASTEAVLDALLVSGFSVGTDHCRLSEPTLWRDPIPPLRVEGEWDGVGRTAVAVYGLGQVARGDHLRRVAARAAKHPDIAAMLVIAFAYAADALDGHMIDRLPVVRTIANYDLMIEGLKREPKNAEAIVAIGVPDVALTRAQPTLWSNRWTATVNGWDIWDPGRNAMRHGRPEQLLGWFVDTNYDPAGAFTTRRMHFPGQEGDRRLKALNRIIGKRRLDATAWAAIFSATSAPFDAPATGKVAVRLVTEHGLEMMKVLRVPR